MTITVNKIEGDIMISIGDSVSFKLVGTDGKEHTIDDFQGKVLILYTYPKDHTPGCTNQACRFRDLNELFKEHNAVILGVNRDSISTHQRFTDKHQLPFTLLSDPDGLLLEPLGALNGKKVLRNTYIIDEKGRLEQIFKQVSAKTNPDEVLDYLKNRMKL